MIDLKETLTHKYGPLPGYAWVAIGAGGLVLVAKLGGGKSSSAAGASPARSFLTTPPTGDITGAGGGAGQTQPSDAFDWTLPDPTTPTTPTTTQPIIDLGGDVVAPRTKVEQPPPIAVVQPLSPLIPVTVEAGGWVGPVNPANGIPIATGLSGAVSPAATSAGLPAGTDYIDPQHPEWGTFQLPIAASPPPKASSSAVYANAVAAHAPDTYISDVATLHRLPGHDALDLA